MKTASWVIVQKDTREPIAETFLPHVAAAVNREKYEAVPIRTWLAEVNVLARQRELRREKAGRA